MILKENSCISLMQREDRMGIRSSLTPSTSGRLTFSLPFPRTQILPDQGSSHRTFARPVVLGQEQGSRKLRAEISEKGKGKGPESVVRALSTPAAWHMSVFQSKFSSTACVCSLNASAPVGSARGCSRGSECRSWTRPCRRPRLAQCPLTKGLRQADAEALTHFPNLPRLWLQLFLEKSIPFLHRGAQPCPDTCNHPPHPACWANCLCTCEF